MLTHIKRLFKHSVIYGLFETVSRGTGFFLMFMYLRIPLTDSQIGIRTSLYVASAFLGLFCTLGLNNAFLRYFMEDEYRHKQDVILTTSIVFTLLVGLSFLLITMFWGETASSLITGSTEYVYVTRLLFIILILDTIVIYPTLILRAEKRFTYYSFVSGMRFVLFIGMNALLVWFLGRGVRGIFEANLLVVACIAGLFFPVYRRYLCGRISVTVLKRMLLFSIPTIFGVFAMRIIDFSDRIIILRFLGDAMLGQYAYAYQLGMVGIMVFVNSFHVAWQPFFLSLPSSRCDILARRVDPSRPSSRPVTPDEADETFRSTRLVDATDKEKHPAAPVRQHGENDREIYSRVATYYAMFIGIIFLGIVLFREEIFSIYAPGRPLSLANIIPFIAFSYIVYGFYIIMLPGLYIREKTVYLPMATFSGAALNLGLNFFFIPKFGIIGAAYTTIIAYVVMVSVLYYISRSIYLVRYEFKRLWIVMLLTSATIALSFLYEPSAPVLKFGYKCVLCCIPLLFYCFSTFLTPEEKLTLRAQLRKILPF